MAQHFFTSSTPDNATVGATSTKIVDAKSGRCYLSITNDSDEDIYLAFGTAAILNKGERLNAYGGNLMIEGDAPYKGEIYAICASGSKNICINEA